jgi:hypothetical protein
MPTIKVTLDPETYRSLSDSAIRELRPIPWQVLVLLRGALGLSFPTPSPGQTAAPAEPLQ